MLNQGSDKHFRVAILGANGQVGTELCLFLKAMEFCDPIAIARSPQSTALLKRAGVECRWGDLIEPQVAARLLGDCDLIFDLALPSGKNLRETRKMVRERALSLFSVARPSKGFVLASTTAVYRYNAAMPFFRAYRSMKLYSERLYRSLGSKHGRRVYVFRLGQVHGAMQSCSQLIRRGLSRNQGPVYVPDQPSDAIFVSAIAESIRAVLFEGIAPKTYTMISQPALSFADLIDLYTERLGIEASVNLERVKTISPMKHAVSAIRGWVKQGQSALIDHYKELLSAVVSTGSEDMDQKLRFLRIRKIATSTIERYFDSLRYRPFEPIYEIPGNRFPFAADSWATLRKAEQDVDNLISNLLPNGTGRNHFDHEYDSRSSEYDAINSPVADLIGK